MDPFDFSTNRRFEEKQGRTVRRSEAIYKSVKRKSDKQTNMLTIRQKEKDGKTKKNYESLYYKLQQCFISEDFVKVECVKKTQPFCI